MTFSRVLEILASGAACDQRSFVMITSSTRRNERRRGRESARAGGGQTVADRGRRRSAERVRPKTDLSANATRNAGGRHRLERHLRIQPKSTAQTLAKRRDAPGSSCTTKSASCVARGIAVEIGRKRADQHVRNSQSLQGVDDGGRRFFAIHRRSSSRRLKASRSRRISWTRCSSASGNWLRMPSAMILLEARRVGGRPATCLCRRHLPGPFHPLPIQSRR